MVNARTSSSGDTISEVTEVDLGRDLDSGGVEAEAWSITVDKKTLKKMTPKDIKRQDTIWGECRPLKKIKSFTHHCSADNRFSYEKAEDTHMYIYLT